MPKPLDSDGLREMILNHESQKPIALDPKEYEAHLGATAIKRVQRGSEMLDSVKKVLQDCASAQRHPSKQELNLALKQLEEGLASFQFALVYMNCGGAGPAHKADKVTLWNPPGRKTRK